VLRPHEADIDIGSDDVKGGSFKVDVPVAACTDRRQCSCAVSTGGVRSGLKVGWERRQGEAVADSKVLLHGTAAGPEDDHEGFIR